MAGIYAPPNGIGVSELSQRQQQLHANWPASEAFDELPHRLGHLVPFSDPLLQFMRHVLGGITRPALQRIESHHAQGMVVLTRKEVADQSPVIGPVLVRLPPCRSAAKILSGGR